jgi:hypothetical protein
MAAALGDLRDDRGSHRRPARRLSRGLDVAWWHGTYPIGWRSTQARLGCCAAAPAGMMWILTLSKTLSYDPIFAHTWAEAPYDLSYWRRLVNTTYSFPLGSDAHRSIVPSNAGGEQEIYSEGR